MSFEGTWKIEIPTPMGKQNVELVIVHTGKELSGAATQGGESIPFIDPQVDGDRITWTQQITKPMKLKLKFDLKRTGDTLEGTAKPGIFPLTTVFGRRVV